MDSRGGSGRHRREIRHRGRELSGSSRLPSTSVPPPPRDPNRSGHFRFPSAFFSSVSPAGPEEPVSEGAPGPGRRAGPALTLPLGTAGPLDADAAVAPWRSSRPWRASSRWASPRDARKGAFVPHPQPVLTSPGLDPGRPVAMARGHYSGCLSLQGEGSGPHGEPGYRGRDGLVSPPSGGVGAVRVGVRGSLHASLPVGLS